MPYMFITSPCLSERPNEGAIYLRALLHRLSWALEPPPLLYGGFPIDGVSLWCRIVVRTPYLDCLVRLTTNEPQS